MTKRCDGNSKLNFPTPKNKNASSIELILLNIIEVLTVNIVQNVSL